MSSDFHRPTYAFPQGIFNATEVRLYGKPGAIETNDAGSFVNGREFDIDIQVKAKGERGDHRGQLNPFDWGITEFGLKISSACILDSMNTGQLLFLAAAKILIDERENTAGPASWGVIYSYAYEGHVYDLPKPKLMLLPVMPQDLPADDAGYSDKPGYRVWVVDKLQKCMEVEVNQGFVEQIVLDANLPGKRSPTMYASKMMMSHRGGKLNE